jgi:hypothetical protein
MTDNASEGLDISQKTRLTLPCRVIHGNHQSPTN